MRAGIENFLTAYDKPAPPAEIRQQPLDGDPGHYARLSALDDGAFALIFPELESLWRAWWRFETPGQAVAALQYRSCLLYQDRDNPIFAPWTRNTKER